MERQDVIIEVGNDFVATITLNRPEQLNTFTVPLAEELDRSLMDLDSRDDARVIIVKGAGRAFCTGIDVEGFFEKSVTEYAAWIERMGAPLMTMSRMRKPVIAQVHGAAAAIGAGLVAAADLAVASEDARIGLTAINVGLNCIGPVVPVTRCIGRKRALELLFFGDMITSAEALDMGLVNRVFPGDELEEKTRTWAAVLALKSPMALQTAKKAFYTAADMDYYKAFQHMTEVLSKLCASHDAKEGITAFLEKRKPEWKGI